MHLAGQADGDDVLAGEPVGPGPTGSRRPRRPTRAPGPARSRAAAGRRSRTRPTPMPTTAPLVDQDGLGRRRRDVDAEDVRHRQRRRRLSRPAASTAQMAVDHALQQLLAAGHRLRVDTAGRHLRGRGPRATLAVEDRAPERALPARVARFARRSTASRPRACRRPRGATARACRCRRCGRGTGPSGRCSGGAAWRRS